MIESDSTVVILLYVLALTFALLWGFVSANIVARWTGGERIVLWSLLCAVPGHLISYFAAFFAMDLQKNFLDWMVSMPLRSFADSSPFFVASVLAAWLVLRKQRPKTDRGIFD